MFVWEMRVGMCELIVPVPMTVARARNHWVGMSVRMMFVMLVRVFVLERLVRVQVLMPLGQMQPHARGHENAG